jgi:hypothetical protein
VEKHLDNLKELIKHRDCDGIKEEMKKFITSYREPDHHFKEAVKLKVEKEKHEKIKSGVLETC